MAPRSLIIGEKAKARLRYFFGEVLREGMSDERVKRQLLKQMLDDPLTFAERLNKLLPDDPAPAPAAGPAMSFNLQFLSAVRDVSARPLEVKQELPVIEHREDVEW